MTVNKTVYYDANQLRMSRKMYIVAGFVNKSVYFWCCFFTTKWQIILDIFTNTCIMVVSVKEKEIYVET